MKAKSRIQTQIDSAKNEANSILTNDNPQVSQVTAALNKIKAVQPELDKAIAMLKNKRIIMHWFKRNNNFNKLLMK